ncbi:uncharacterized protein LOC111323295 [Stylophora pistillata]|uniref:uncharacterized protein LOC111323295 n=1 Tax=Stylophora pistillata TaxID=50429 RepID=UPI000C051211|nr:uncharacterized protein LOC111323295 [Stylophora pistillata]
MSSKGSRSKVSFKLFSANNYSQLASRFPFLKKRQIKTKLLQSWKKFQSSTETTTSKGEIQKPKFLNEIVASEAESGPLKRREEDVLQKKSERSPIITYSVRQRNQDDCAKRKNNDTASEVDCTSSLIGMSRASDDSKMVDNKLLSKRRKQNELIDLFEEIDAETLLIEPEHIRSSDIDLVSSTAGSFDHNEWLKKLREVTFVESNNTVSGMFKWRADGKKNTQRNVDENKHKSRFLGSNDYEGGSNFFSMFEHEDDIFL